jgi:hypothetical protein
MNRLTHNLLLLVLFSCSAGVVEGQTSSQLRARYGEPQMVEIENDRPVVERFLVRPDIQMTIRYTDSGEPCEALLEPVPKPKTHRQEHTPDRDYMSTTAVIELINEVLPDAKRGKRLNSGQFNGGDPKMKLHHLGCTGLYYVNFENARISAVSWCLGGTSSATIQWSQKQCRVRQ